MKDLRLRLLDVLPTSTYHLDRFLHLGDLRFDQVCPTACIESGPRPVVHFNPDFVKKYCQTDQSLFMLLMHEMNHLMLGHLALFGRSTEAKNIVFDAVINAMLCQQFPDSAYTSLFTSLYSWDKFPERLLRPPPGWPNNPEPLPPDATDKEREACKMLYSSSWEDTTYGRLFELIEQDVDKALNKEGGGNAGNGGNSQGPVLIGDHSATNKDGEMNHHAKQDPLISDMVEDIKRSVSQQAGHGTELYEKTASKKIAGQEFICALLQLVRKVQRTARISGDRLPSNHSYPVIGVIPDGRDRKRHAWKNLTGKDLILQTRHTLQPRSRSEKRRPMDVYLDVSGSMGDDAISYTMNGLLPLVRQGFCKVFVFSDAVWPISESNLVEYEYKSSYGTSLDCVFEHFFNHPAHLTPRSLVILTDMEVEEPEEKHLLRKRELGVKVAVGLINGMVAIRSVYIPPIVDMVEKIPDPI